MKNKILKILKKFPISHFIFNKLIFIKQIIKMLSDDFSLAFFYAKDRRLQDHDYLYSKLRTLCHILDKGLHVIPFEKGHSSSIYKECLLIKENLQNSEFIDDTAYTWCTQVLEEYKKAQEQNTAPFQNETTILEYSKNEKNAFYSFIKSRISCRNFINKPIDNDIWNEIISIAIDAPSSCLRFATRYYIEKDSKKIETLTCNIAGATCFSAPIPYLICVTSSMKNYSLQDRYLPYIDASLSIENFLLGCRANNIACVALNWLHASNTENKKVREILNIPNHEHIILFIAAGYPKELPRKPQRLDTKWIRKL